MNRGSRFLIMAIAPVTFFALACTIHSAATSFEHVAPGTRIAVIAFRDCTIPDQEDCHGSGNIASSIIASTLGAGGQFTAVPISRPVPPNHELSDAAAIEEAKTKGFAFVVNGEVNNFYRVAPMTFRTDKLSLSARVLRVTDGAVVASAVESSESVTNFATPEGMIKRIAKKLREAL
jgi:hypothetical protein